MDVIPPLAGTLEELTLQSSGEVNGIFYSAFELLGIIFGIGEGDNRLRLFKMHIRFPSHSMWLRRSMWRHIATILAADGWPCLEQVDWSFSVMATDAAGNQEVGPYATYNWTVSLSSGYPIMTSNTSVVTT